MNRYWPCAAAACLVLGAMLRPASYTAALPGERPQDVRVVAGPTEPVLVRPVPTQWVYSAVWVDCPTDPLPIGVPPAVGDKWYKFQKLQLDSRGELGWELIHFQMQPGSGKAYIIFKQPAANPMHPKP